MKMDRNCKSVILVTLDLYSFSYFFDRLSICKDALAIPISASKAMSTAIFF